MPSTKAYDQGKLAFKKDCVIHQIKAGIKLSHIEATMTHAGKAGIERQDPLIKANPSQERSRSGTHKAVVGTKLRSPAVKQISSYYESIRR